MGNLVRRFYRFKLIMDSANKQHAHSLKEALLFIKHYFLSPLKTGSIYPSSPALGKAMVSFLKNKEQSTVIAVGCKRFEGIFQTAADRRWPRCGHGGGGGQ